MSSMWIAGKAVETHDRFGVVDPATGETFDTAPCADRSHIDDAVRGARDAFAGFSKDIDERRRMLLACAETMKQQVNTIAALITREQGKPIGLAAFEVLGAAMWLEYFAHLPLEDDVLKDGDGRRAVLRRRPLGVVAAITPWNFPISLLCWKLAPALLAGNTVVAKPSPHTPLSSLLLGQLFGEILPPGVFNVISCDDAMASELVNHPIVQKISFTGSIATGKKIAASAASDLKRMTLELGGNDPAILLDDVDPAQVIDAIFGVSFVNAGQLCASIKRVYVHENVHDAVVEGLVARAKAIVVGPGMESSTSMGPLTLSTQRDKVARLVDEAVKSGAQVHCGGAPLNRPGYFYPPTIVSNARAGMALVDEEQFGPAIPIIRYADVDDAIAQANDTKYGLGASVWGADVQRATAIAERIEAGSVWVNQHADLAPNLPFGGLKWSGIGYENGPWGLNEFTAMQLINVKK